MFSVFRVEKSLEFILFICLKYCRDIFEFFKRCVYLKFKFSRNLVYILILGEKSNMGEVKRLLIRICEYVFIFKYIICFLYFVIKYSV